MTPLGSRKSNNEVQIHIMFDYQLINLPLMYFDVLGIACKGSFVGQWDTENKDNLALYPSS